MKKINIADIWQAEDRDLPFSITMNGEPIADVSKMLFVIFTDDGLTQIAKIDSGRLIYFADSTITVKIQDTITTGLLGKHRYELWFQDSAGKDVPVAYGSINFKPTLGRY